MLECLRDAKSEAAAGASDSSPPSASSFYFSPHHQCGQQYSVLVCVCVSVCVCMLSGPPWSEGMRLLYSCFDLFSSAALPPLLPPLFHLLAPPPLLVPSDCV